jgi:hypothetical protein
MPGNIPTVSFSGISPLEFAGLMRWRARYREMSFEPYGIGIEREFALRHGIKPVMYYEKECPLSPQGCDFWLTQSRGMKTDWRNEDEYRFRGDFSLAHVSHDKIVCFCFETKQARTIKRQYGIKAIAFCGKKEAS